MSEIGSKLAQPSEGRHALIKTFGTGVMGVLIGGAAVSLHNPQVRLFKPLPIPLPKEFHSLCKRRSKKLRFSLVRVVTTPVQAFEPYEVIRSHQIW